MASVGGATQFTESRLNGENVRFEFQWWDWRSIKQADGTVERGREQHTERPKTEAETTALAMSGADAWIRPLLGLSAMLWLGSCTGGVDCPTVLYEPSGEMLEPPVENFSSCAGPDECVTFCTSGICGQEADGLYWCESCGGVKAWAAGACPGCIDESTVAESSYDLGLGCTTE
jgi:hypothetical protein